MLMCSQTRNYQIVVFKHRVSTEARPVADSSWTWRWLEAASPIMSKYTTIIADALRYTLYMLILYKVLRSKNRFKA